MQAWQRRQPEPCETGPSVLIPISGGRSDKQPAPPPGIRLCCCAGEGLQACGRLEITPGERLLQTAAVVADRLSGQSAGLDLVGAGGALRRSQRPALAWCSRGSRIDEISNTFDLNHVDICVT